MKDQGRRRIPFPAFREPRLEVLVADGVARHAEVGEREEQLFGHIARDPKVADGGQQDIGLAGRGDH